MKNRRPRSTLLDTAAAVCVILAALIAYSNAVDYFFSQDDFTFLARAMGIAQYPDFTEPFGTRVLSTRIYFQAMKGLFGLRPEPYHWASLFLHALNALLLFAVAKRWTGSRAAAIVAGLAFATSDLAFTAVFWISGVQDLLATTFLLVSTLLWIHGLEKGALWSALSACALGLSVLCKEIGVFFPLVLAMIAWAHGHWNRRKALALLPHAAVSVAAALLLAAGASKVTEAGAYSTGMSSGILHNLATYLKWAVDVVHPFKDRVAAIDHDAWKVAVPAAFVTTLFILTFRGRKRHVAWSAAGWFMLTLAPVLPLLHHTYAYYLYAALVGAATLAGMTADRVSGAMSRAFEVRLRRSEASGTGAVPASTRAGGTLLRHAFTVAAAVALCAMGWLNIRAREHTYLPPDFVLPHDHVLRSSALSQAAASTFPGESIPEGADLILINPFAPVSVDLSGRRSHGGERVEMDMIRMALRDGAVLKVLKPTLGEIRFAYRMEREWENRHGLLYDAYGRLTYLGTGADIWANLSTLHLHQTEDIRESIRCSRRALELRPDHPRAHLNLGIALALSGSEREAREHLSRAAATLPSESLRGEARSWLEKLEEDK